MHRPCSPEDIRLAYDSFHDFFGYEPLGYRAPIGQITRLGLQALMELGLRYDSSIYPSLRPGFVLGYNNLHLPVTPFVFCADGKSILEIPFACVPVVRLNFSLSYVKLFGWNTYRLLLKWFPLPDQAAVLTHPHDHYFHLVQHHVTAPEKPLLLRNARNAFDLLEKMLDHLLAAGYEFEFMSALCDSLDRSALPAYPLTSIRTPA
jgi:peptidoglycan/xylan/chitin deacetylase (PgdA/CDA1 family)